LIMELARSLRKYFDCFFRDVIKINHEIFKKRRQLHREASNSNSKGESFCEFAPMTLSGAQSLKAQFLAEQQAKQQEVEEKEKITEETQQLRKQRRDALAKAYEEQQERASETINATETPPEDEELHFANPEIQDFWETCPWEKYLLNDDKIVDMLKALDTAQSTFHLRSLLPSGTKLEVLSGDRQGQISLRLNDQWRLCFYWVTDQGACNIKFVDYH
jgi:toxin HigB-1